MKLLILTQYFPPETGAPQNRLFELAVHMQKKGAGVSILTAMPNYPQMKIYDAYRRKWRYYEEMEGLKIYRSWIWVSLRRGMAARLMNYFSFVFSSFFAGCFRTGKCDIILCESPPLFLGITAYLLKKIKGAKLIFNVSDLWPESAEKLGIVKNRFFLGMAGSLEKFMYRKSELITGQTQGIVKNISSRFPGKKVYWLPNGADLDYYRYDRVASSWRADHHFYEADFILLYAGIIGYAQGLETLLEAADMLRDKKDIKFILLGSGPEKEKLLQLRQEKNIENILFFDPVPKIQMPAVIKACDMALVPLKKLDLFRGAIPSKIFECLAMKKPLLLGVEGEAKELFIDEGRCGLAFEPENAKDLSEKILQAYRDRTKLAEWGNNALAYVSRKFDRRLIADDFWKVVTGLKT